MELHPCSCGEQEFAWSEHRLARQGDRLVSTYEGICGRCGVERSFTFEVTGVAPPVPAFGADAPSQIIDPGEFLAVSSELAGSVPDDPASLDPDDLDDAYDAIAASVAALDEVLKFVPSGEDGVPPEAFFSARGAELYRDDPDQFGRERLRSMLAARRAVLSDYESASSR